MTATFDPYVNPQDYVTIGGQRTPGIAEIVDADSIRRVIERRGFALSGATARDQGRTLTPFKIRLRFYSSADFESWDAFRPLLARPPGRATTALDVAHPIFELADIRAAIPKKTGQPVQTGEGEWTIELEFLEYRNPQPANDPVASAVGVVTPGNGSPEQQIEALTRELHDEAALGAFAAAP